VHGGTRATSSWAKNWVLPSVPRPPSSGRWYMWARGHLLGKRDIWVRGPFG
jgi:hypothetical protein